MSTNVNNGIESKECSYVSNVSMRKVNKESDNIDSVTKAKCLFEFLSKYYDSNFIGDCAIIKDEVEKIFTILEFDNAIYTLNENIQIISMCNYENLYNKMKPLLHSLTIELSLDEFVDVIKSTGYANICTDGIYINAYHVRSITRQIKTDSKYELEFLFDKLNIDKSNIKLLDKYSNTLNIQNIESLNRLVIAVLLYALNRNPDYELSIDIDDLYFKIVHNEM